MRIKILLLANYTISHGTTIFLLVLRCGVCGKKRPKNVTHSAICDSYVPQQISQKNLTAFVTFRDSSFP